MATEKRLIDAKGKFVLNAGDLTGHIMCFENGYATVFDRFAKVNCKFSLMDAPSVDAVEVVHGRWVNTEMGTLCTNCKRCYDPDFEIRRSVCRELKHCPDCGAKMDGGTDHAS